MSRSRKHNDRTSTSSALEVHWTAHSTDLKGRRTGILRVVYLPPQEMVTGRGATLKVVGQVDDAYMLTHNHLPVGCNRYCTVEAAINHAKEWGAANAERHYPVRSS